MKKVFWMNKETLQKMFPKLNILVGSMPIIKLNDMILFAKLIKISTNKEDKWKEFEQTNIFEVIQDLIAANGYFYMLENKVDDVEKYVDIYNYNITNVDKIVSVDNIDEADIINFRYYTNKPESQFKPTKTVFEDGSAIDDNGDPIYVN